MRVVVDEVLDRLLVEARGELAADVEEVVELEDLHGEALVERRSSW